MNFMNLTKTKKLIKNLNEGKKISNEIQIQTNLLSIPEISFYLKK